VESTKLSHTKHPKMSEKLCLKWHDFQENTNSAIGNLRNDQDFTDITLACEDGQQTETHKVILAASSPFFKNLLGKNKHPHPLVYMRGMRSEDLVAIIDFLYYGEANIYEENIDAFLVLAEELQLKGLTGNKVGEHDEENPSKQTIMSNQIKIEENPIKSEKNNTQKRNYNIYSEQIYSEKNNTQKINYVKKREMASTEENVSLTNNAVYYEGGFYEIQAFDEKVRSLMQKSQNLAKRGNRRADMCTVCGKEGENTEIKNHIEANHLEGVSIPCNYCEKTFRY